MKKGFLSVLLTLGMVLMMLPTTAYAGKALCETCGKWVGTTSTYDYKKGAEMIFQDLWQNYSLD